MARTVNELFDELLKNVQEAANAADLKDFPGSIKRLETFKQEADQLIASFEMSISIKQKGIGDLLASGIESLGLSQRALNVLKQNGIVTVADLLRLDLYTIITMKNMGVKTETEILEVLHDHHLQFELLKREVVVLLD